MTAKLHDEKSKSRRLIQEELDRSSQKEAVLKEQIKDLMYMNFALSTDASQARSERGAAGKKECHANAVATMRLL